MTARSVSSELSQSQTDDEEKYEENRLLNTGTRFSASNSTKAQLQRKEVIVSWSDDEGSDDTHSTKAGNTPAQTKRTLSPWPRWKPLFYVSAIVCCLLIISLLIIMLLLIFCFSEEPATASDEIPFIPLASTLEPTEIPLASTTLQSTQAGTSAAPQQPRILAYKGLFVDNIIGDIVILMVIVTAALVVLAGCFVLYHTECTK